MGIQEYLQEATGKGASDLFIVAGLPLTYKINRNDKGGGSSDARRYP